MINPYNYRDDYFKERAELNVFWEFTNFVPIDIDNWQDTSFEGQSITFTYNPAFDRPLSLWDKFINWLNSKSPI